MPKGGSTESFVQHCNAVRVRVNGTGNLKLKLYSLKEKASQTLKDLPMDLTTDQTKQRLANFKKERMKLEVKITEIDETFEITQILIYLKPVAGDYPHTS